jgi:TPR repeat protein
MCLQKGEGVSKDFKAAAQYLKLAADQGNAAAQNNYGKCLSNGEGVGIDFQGAAHYFELAADQGIATDQRIAAAQFHYGSCVQNGEGVSKDLKGAACYYKLAADQGFADAQFNYGIASGIATESQLIWQDQQIISNSPQIKVIPLLNILMLICCGMEEGFRRSDLLF